MCLICVTFLAIRETKLEAVFCVFHWISGSPRFRAYKNEHNLQPEALKVTKSEFFDEKCVCAYFLFDQFQLMCFEQLKCFVPYFTAYKSNEKMKKKNDGRTTAARFFCLLSFVSWIAFVLPNLSAYLTVLSLNSAVNDLLLMITCRLIRGNIG